MNNNGENAYVLAAYHNDIKLLKYFETKNINTEKYSKFKKKITIYGNTDLNKIYNLPYTNIFLKKKT